MNGKAVMSGLCGFLLLTTPVFADPRVVSTEKAYRLLQAISAQIQEARQALVPSNSAEAAAALATAEKQVRIAFAHCCRSLYTAHLQAAKAALAQHDQRQALQHLLEADQTLEMCAEPTSVSEPPDDQEIPTFKSALAQR